LRVLISFVGDLPFFFSSCRSSVSSDVGEFICNALCCCLKFQAKFSPPSLASLPLLFFRFVRVLICFFLCCCCFSFSFSSFFPSSYTDKTVQRDRALLPFSIVNREGRPYVSVQTGGESGETKVYSPEEISAMVLTKMKEIAEQIARVAPTPTTVLIRGESGTGKELVARAIHRYSHLRDKPLITVNCTALTPTLMESELFGHKRGAFTGAVADKVGLFEKADGGTIFLDEVGDMPVEMQGKLLRVLQAGESKPVGDVVTRRVRVRVIAATNRDLEKALAAGEFRQDLFYRFNTFTIVLPPLRERAEDIPVLAHHFLRKAEAKVNKKVERFSPEALDLMKRYAWPGNLRELENSIERAVVLAPGRQVEVGHLPFDRQESSPIGVTTKETFLDGKARVVALFEREAVSRFLAESRGNISLAAQRSGITRRNFHRLISKYTIKRRDYTDESC